MYARYLKLALSLVLSFGAIPTYGASIQLEFTGQFGSCMFECTGSPLSVLSGTMFNGSMLIPSDLPSRSPDLQNYPFGTNEFEAMLWSHYNLQTNESHLTVQTQSPSLSFAQATPITIIVSHCTGSGCARNQNFVWLYFAGPEITFNLILGSSLEGTVETDSFPTLAQLGRLRPGFEIFRNDFSAYIGGGIATFPETSMTMAVRAVPVPSSIALLTIPVLALGFTRRR